MNTERIEKDDGRLDLSQYMTKVIDELKEDRRYPAVHTYSSTLRNFNKMLGVLAKRLLPGIKISSYTARHA